MNRLSGRYHLRNSFRCARLGLITSVEFRRQVAEAAREAIRSASILGEYLHKFAAWALAETDARTVGDAVAQVVTGARASEEWRILSELELKCVGDQAPHAYIVIDRWADQLPERERRIFKARVASVREGPTLQELGNDYGVTRERVRQLETQVRYEFAGFIRAADGLPIQWRIQTLKKAIGVAAPLTHVQHLISPIDGCTYYGALSLELAGPYDRVNEWIVLRSAAETDPTSVIRSTANEIGHIDHGVAARELRKWGLDSSLHEDWLTRDGKILNMNGQLVCWGGSIGDKLVLALADLGRVATVDTLLDHIQANTARSSAFNALALDPRVVRANRTEWALASWGLPEYRSIAMAIHQILESEGRPILVEEIVNRMHSDFGTRDGSVRAYCQAAMFVIEDGAIRLRREDEPFVYDNVSIRNASGVFALGPQRVSILLEVDADLLRGSGRNLTHAAGAILGVTVNQQLTFTSSNGIPVSVTFPGTSFAGPSLGSVRALAESLSVKQGSYLTLVLDRSDMSVAARSTEIVRYEPDWLLVAKLTGIDASAGIEGLADALRCDRDEVREFLRIRGDDVVCEALPTQGALSETE